MKDEDFEPLGALIYDGRTDRRTDICNCRVAFATEKEMHDLQSNKRVFFHCTAHTALKLHLIHIHILHTSKHWENKNIICLLPKM